ncbi:MAG: VCBS repeat-containing protein [Candidatus Magnetoovum sp. WYHC-5]|nr:VCBS repeat-containing protein [Candidatus Magnetoovum sp. WYHC-5]
MLKKSLILISLIALFLLVRNSYGDTLSPLKPLRDETVGFFKPVKLEVVSVKDKNVTIRFVEGVKLVVGMRLDVFREGQTFYHPVTNEPLGNFEKPVGILEVVEISSNTISGTMLTGVALTGDRARISKSKIKALFYQDKSVNWHLGDSYFRLLKDAQRFELIDTSIITDSMETVRQEASAHGAQIIVFIDGQQSETGILFRERVFWVDDGKEIFSKSIDIPNEYIAKLVEAAPFAVTVENEPILTFKLSSGFSLVAVADLNGDGKEEIILSLEGVIKVFDPGADLAFLYDIDELRNYEHIYINCVDINKNGKDELVVSVIGERDAVQSYIYELAGEKFNLLWKTDGFLRTYTDSILYQKFSKREGYKGQIYELSWVDGFKPSTPIDVPENINIYDFIQTDVYGLGAYTLAYDKNNNLNVYDKSKKVIWQTEKRLGGYAKEFERQPHNIMVDAGTWHINDKIYNWHNNLVVVDRVPFTNMVTTLGFKESKLYALRWNGVAMEKDLVIDKISGNLLDYAIYKDKAYVLSRPPLGVDIKYIVKGKNPVLTYLSVYAINP